MFHTFTVVEFHKNHSTILPIVHPICLVVQHLERVDLQVEVVVLVKEHHQLLDQNKGVLHQVTKEGGPFFNPDNPNNKRQ